MILIDTITKSIQAQTSVAPISNLPCIIHANKISKDMANVPIGPVEITTGISNIAVDIVPVPDADNQLIDVRYVSIYNPNTDTHTINIALYDSSGPSTTRIHRVTLRYRWRAEYNVDNGWRIYDEFGVIVDNYSLKIPVLYQSNPGAALTDLFTATNRAIIKKITVANRAATAKTFRLSIAPLGAADAVSQYLYYDVSIPKNETREILGPFDLVASDVVRVYGQDNNVTFTINGITEG